MESTIVPFFDFVHQPSMRSELPSATKFFKISLVKSWNFPSGPSCSDNPEIKIRENAFEHKKKKPGLNLTRD